MLAEIELQFHRRRSRLLKKGCRLAGVLLREPGGFGAGPVKPTYQNG